MCCNKIFSAGSPTKTREIKIFIKKKKANQPESDFFCNRRRKCGAWARSSCPGDGPTHGNLYRSDEHWPQRTHFFANNRVIPKFFSFRIILVVCVSREENTKYVLAISDIIFLHARAKTADTVCETQKFYDYGLGEVHLLHGPSGYATGF